MSDLQGLEQAPRRVRTRLMPLESCDEVVDPDPSLAEIEVGPSFVGPHV